MLHNWHMGLRDRIDRSRRAPLHSQIIDAIIRDIENGQLAPGAWLPSSRYLAETLGLNRKTVVSAYAHLIAEGWLASLGTRGTAVAVTLPGRSAGTLPDAGPCGVGYRFRKSRLVRGTRRLPPAALCPSLDVRMKDQG